MDYTKSFRILGAVLLTLAGLVVFVLFCAVPIARFTCKFADIDVCSVINRSGSNVEQVGNDSTNITQGDSSSSSNSQNNTTVNADLSYSEVINKKGGYFDYRPNDVACLKEQILIYDSIHSRWVCGSLPTYNVPTQITYGATGKGIESSGNIFSLELDGGSLSLGSGGIKVSDSYDDNFLTVSTSFSGDITGTLSTISVTDDSHNHTGSTISGLGVSSFISPNVSQWTNDANYVSDGNTDWDNLYGFITGVDYSQIANLAGSYMDYRPNGVACTNNQILVYETSNSRWVCGDVQVYSASGNGIEESLGVFSLELDGSTLSVGASGIKVSDSYDDNFLTISTNYGGDVSGTYDNITIVNDSHSHTGTTISGLGVTNFSSPNISQWTNDANYISDGNTGWDNLYGFITDGNVNWDNSYGFVTGVTYSQLGNGSGVYMDYRPNNVACSNDQILVYETANSRWVCGTAANNFLTLSTVFSGDVTGTYNTISVTDDSHNHTGTTISGLGVGDFTSANISQWTNNSGYYNSSNDGSGSGLDADLLDGLDSGSYKNLTTVVTNSSDITISGTGTAYTFTFDSEIVDDLGFFSGPSQTITSGNTGIYMVCARVLNTGFVTLPHTLRVVRNGFYVDTKTETTDGNPSAISSCSIQIPDPVSNFYNLSIVYDASEGSITMPAQGVVFSIVKIL
jgi:hypothetical protein